MGLRFGQIELDLDAFEVRRKGQRVHVEPQVFEVVRYLVEHRDRMVPKEELLEQVWGTRFVSESALTSRIKAARRALDDDGREQRVIRTVHGRGYRFVAPVSEAGPAAVRADLLRAFPQGPPMLEREDALQLLEDAVADASAGRGRVVLISGEAGIGKTSVVRAFLASHKGLRALVGTCDDLVTPLPLGPLRDVASDAAPQLAEALESPAAGDVQRALLAELGRAPAPALLVVEDLHWADEATIDVLTFTGRRLADVPAVVVLTYRDPEVVAPHPLLRLLGNVPVDVARRIALRPLSTEAVAELVGPDRTADVLAATGGLPFFVNELAAMGPGADDERLPTSVAHAVLARVGKLPPGTGQLLDLLAVEPSRTDVAVLDIVRPSWVEDIEPAERTLLVTVEDQTVAFRHDLARRAVLDAVPTARRRALHQQVARVLATRAADPARVVHHAEAAGDSELLVAQALLAARQASSCPPTRRPGRTTSASCRSCS